LIQHSGNSLFVQKLSTMRKHTTTKVKISEEMTGVAKCPFKSQTLVGDLKF